MRILDIPKYERRRRVQLHIRRDKMSTYQRRRALRAYPVVMQRAGSKSEGPTLEQRQAFAHWVEDVVEGFTAEPRKWTVSRIAEKGGVHRNAIYDWMGLKAVPKRETVKRFCQGLGIDYTEPARLLGWIDAAPAPKDLEQFIWRARTIAEHEGTSERRRAELEVHIKNAEATIEAMKEIEQAAEARLRAVLEDPEEADR